MTAERYVATRTVAAPPTAVFALLTDPNRHQDTEPGDWVRDAVSTEPITAAGQTFVLNMFLDQPEMGHYVMHNLVTAFVPDRTIVWLPGQLDDAGNHSPGGWFWRYDLTPNGAGTDITLTYDWTDTPQALRDEIGGLPPFPPQYLDDSLAALDRAVTGS